MRRSEGEDVRAKIIAGEPFARLAGDYSDSDRRPTAACRSACQSDLSGSAEGDRRRKTGGGPRCARRAAIKSSDRKLSDSTTKPFDEARSEIADKVANGKRQGEYRKFIAKLRTEAIIDWKNDEIKKA
jgi:hypothetical protein